MKRLLRDLVDVLASLRVTVGLLLMSMVLVFAATLEQVHSGIWRVQEDFFRSVIVTWAVPGTGVSVPVFPGGYTVGALLLANLVCAQAVRFRATWRSAGLHLAHAGIVVLLLGELVTGLTRRDGTLRLLVGQTKGYSEGLRSYELAIVERGEPAGQPAEVVPAADLARRSILETGRLPFEVAVVGYFPECLLQERAGPQDGIGADHGAGVGLSLVSAGQSPGGQATGVPGAYIRVSSPAGVVGTWLVSPLLAERQFISLGGREWEIALRPERLVLPVSLTLLGVTNETYPGTAIPKNFVSRLRVSGGPSGEDREVTISMNVPFRTGGFTFYQYQMNAAGGESVLEVVRDPSWVVPYVACAMMGAGLIIHFLCSLVSFLGRGRSAEWAPGGAAARAPALLLLSAAAAMVVIPWPVWRGDAPDLGGFGSIPVLVGGRVKPLDSVARSALLELQGRQRVDAPGGDGAPAPGPDAWLADVLFVPSRADTYPTFRVESPEVLDTLGLGETASRISYPDPARRTLALLGLLPSRRSRFSFDQIRSGLGELGRQARLADALDPGRRTRFQGAVLEMRDKVELYQRLKSSLQPPDRDDLYGDLLALGRGAKSSDARGAMAARFDFMEKMGYLRSIPPDDWGAGGWRSMGAALGDSLAAGAVHPGALALARIGHAWRTGDQPDFTASVASYLRAFRAGAPGQSARIRFECLFNRSEPFYKSMLLYCAALILGVLSWLCAPRILGRTSFWLIALAWVVATAGIVSRMWIEGRPPVTNLYSSALFVGWASVGLCIALERARRNAVVTVAAAMIGFSTLLVAHHLALAGDTMEMMRAVLDSNFWLATHVVAVTLGYASTFLAGFLALVYVARGMLPGGLDKETELSLGGMVYGVVCFATLFSLVGTVLGGIWADQSWGRFWGWDPKENGALLIVLWNAVILHARSDNLLGTRGLMVMAILGNVVTGWSWFGVNMLGIGLHSYGFTESAFVWLVAFAVSQLAVAGVALARRPRG